MLTFWEISEHLNRPPSELEEEIREARSFHCEKLARIRKTYPIKKWISDKANLISNAQFSYTGTDFFISFHSVAIEDVIEHLAGPIHREFNCFWRMKSDITVDLIAIKPIKIPDSNFNLRIFIYIYHSTDCKLIEEKRVTEVSIWKMDCTPKEG
jgi:hypothetical protein